MKITLSAASLFLFALTAGCSKPTVVGKWTEEGVEHGMYIEFGDSGQFVTHGEGAEGSHDHFRGTWTLSANTVTLQGKWDSTKKEARWTGTLADASLTIDTEPGKPARRFRRN